MVFFIYFNQFRHCKAVTNGFNWFQIYYSISGAFYIGNIFRSMSLLECAFQARIEKKSKRAKDHLPIFISLGVYWNIFCNWRINPVSFGAKCSYFQYTVLGLVHIVYVVRLDWLLVCSVDHGNSN